jgi:hypothetical protein
VSAFDFVRRSSRKNLFLPATTRALPGKETSAAKASTRSEVRVGRLESVFSVGITGHIRRRWPSSKRNCMTAGTLPLMKIKALAVIFERNEWTLRPSELACHS